MIIRFAPYGKKEGRTTKEGRKEENKEGRKIKEGRKEVKKVKENEGSQIKEG